MSASDSSTASERSGEDALAALDSTKRLLEYALLLGLSRSEAVAYLHRTAGLQPALTELGACVGACPCRESVALTRAWACSVGQACRTERGIFRAARSTPGLAGARP